jgi:predicted nucleotidyltransferase
VPYFTPAERVDAREQLVTNLRRQTGVDRIVRLGSDADGRADRHSDVDLAVVVTADAEVSAVAAACTQTVLETLPVFHHFSQSLGQMDFRGFLLESFLEIDIGFAPEGVLDAETTVPGVDAASKLDFIWHDVIHAAVALDRGRPRRALLVRRAPPQRRPRARRGAPGVGLPPFQGSR